MIPLSRPQIDADDVAAVVAVLESGMLAQGAQVAAFESEFSATVDRRACVAVNSGTSALHIGMLAAGVGPGDDVIVPALSFGATANAVALCGATPVFADIDPATFNLDPVAAADAVTERTTAIIVVHLYGQPAKMDALADLARDRRLVLIEDAAQAHGATFADRAVGAFGDVAAFSFYPTKNMTTGEGGMIVTPHEEVANRARLLRNQGMRGRYEHEIVGFNVRMTDMAAALGRSQLRKLEGWNAQRSANAKVYDARLRGVVLPTVDTRAQHVYHQYTIRTPTRNDLRLRLTQAGIGTGVYYPTPLHRLAPFDHGQRLPAAEKAAAEVLSLPVRPDLTADELEAVIACVNG